MTTKSLEKTAANKSISNKKFFKILLKYLHDWETRDQKSKIDISSINSPGFKKHEAEMDHLRKFVEKLRPKVMEMLRQYVLKQHEHCCGPKSKPRS